MFGHGHRCVLYPRFELLAALGDRRVLLSEPAALAPEAGREQVVGEVSAPAEAFGVVRGMRLGEAMSRCPALRLVPPDPEGVRSLWGAVLDRLEGIGAEVESDHAGAAFFGRAGSRASTAATSRACWRRPAARSGRRPLRRRAEPLRAHAAALQVRPRRRSPGAPRSPWSAETDVRDFLAPLPVALLRTRPELQALPEVLERLGIRTLGELAALPSRAVAERFGHPGLLALDLGRGRDTPLEPRRPSEPVVERLDLPEAASGQQLERALELLIARVLARRERRGRSLRALAVSARASWPAAPGAPRSRCGPRAPTPPASGSRSRQRLAELPAPSESLALEVEAFGPPAHDQGRLLDEAASVRRARLGEAVRQARQAAGADAALRVLDVDPTRRIPERRARARAVPRRVVTPDAAARRLGTPKPRR